MESIEKLRELCAKWRKTSITPGRNSAADEVDKIANEIEREIAERYMELPVDADGVPWHIGDTVEGHGKVQSLDLNRHGWAFFGVENAIDPAIHRHAKPRTVEDILFDAVGDAEEGLISPNEIIAKYADEIRKAVGE